MKNMRKNFTIIIAFVFMGMNASTSAKGLLGDENIDPKKKETTQYVVPPHIPEKLTFSEEEVPLGNFDVRESLDRELMVNTFFHSQTIRYIKLAPRFFEIIEPILKQEKIPEDFKYLALAESGFDLKAISPAGAAGIWQFMEATGRENGLEVNGVVDERYHIEKATKAACKYLHQSYAKYGNWTTVAASYNAGRNGINRQVERQKETNYYNLLLSEETNRYVYRILSYKLILESPEAYGFYVPKKDMYPSIPVKIVEVKTSVQNLADFSKEHNINYKILKLFNPWLRENYLKNDSGKTYEIKIPKGRYVE